VLVPVEGATELKAINGLFNPTFADRHIESQSVFLRLSHRLNLGHAERRTVSDIAEAAGATTVGSLFQRNDCTLTGTAPIADNDYRFGENVFLLKASEFQNSLCDQSDGEPMQSKSLQTIKQVCWRLYGWFKLQNLSIKCRNSKSYRRVIGIYGNV
jgi:hypothetical protein